MIIWSTQSCSLHLIWFCTCVYWWLLVFIFQDPLTCIDHYCAHSISNSPLVSCGLCVCCNVSLTLEYILVIFWIIWRFGLGVVKIFSAKGGVIILMKLIWRRATQGVISWIFGVLCYESCVDIGNLLWGSRPVKSLLAFV